MQKSSILSKAGQDLVSSHMNLSIMEVNEQKPQQNKVYLKSSISNNLLQQIDDDYEQIQGIETKYIDENGEQVQKSQIQILSNNQPDKVQNMSLVKKDMNSKNRFIQQPVLSQEPDNKEQYSSQSPIKSYIKNASLSSSKYQAIPNNSSKLFDNQRLKSNGTLLKNYIKSINKYEAQLQELSRMKQNHKKNLNSKQSYLTNQSGLTQQDFYKLDYTNSGKYKLGQGLYNSKISKQTANFFKTQRSQLNEIQDILSDINSLNNSSQNLKYSSAKIFPKNQVNILSSPSKKYKGNKNISTFNSKTKLTDTMQKYKTTKLDELLQGYQLTDTIKKLSDTMTKSYNSFQNKSFLNNKQKQTDQLKMSLSSILDLKQKLQMRRKQRQQNRKKNRFYQQVKDQIKYGIDFNQIKYGIDFNQIKYGLDFNQIKNTQSNKIFSKQKNIDNFQQIKEAGQDQQLESKQDNLQTIRDLSQDKMMLQLVRKFRLYQIKWNFLPIIPIKESQPFLEWSNYPIFSEQQQRIIIEALQKAQTLNLSLYSIFSSKYNKQNEQIFGLREINETKQKQKQYRLMNEKQFSQKWNKVYQQTIKQIKPNNQQLLSTQQLKQLKQFDFKWYQTLVQNLYNKNLQQIQIQYLYTNKNSDQLKSIISISKFKQQVIKFNKKELIKNIYKTNISQYPIQKIRQSIAINKLKMLKNIFSNLNSITQQYSFGYIPSIISKNTTQKEEMFIKNYLKDNFRGGIYFIDKQKQYNICILQLKHNNSLKIDQFSNQITKQVRINQNFVIKLNIQFTTNNKQQDSFILSISTKNNQEKNHIKQSNSVTMNCYYNQIQYQIQSQTDNRKSTQTISLFKKFKINLQT